ncbi:flagellar hook-basal body complex protein FliE, partial [Paraburkholderia sp.]
NKLVTAYNDIMQMSV